MIRNNIPLAGNGERTAKEVIQHYGRKIGEPRTPHNSGTTSCSADTPSSHSVWPNAFEPARGRR